MHHTICLQEKRRIRNEYTHPIRIACIATNQGTKLPKIFFCLFLLNFNWFWLQNGNCTKKSLSSRQYSVKNLSEKFVVVNMRDTSRAAEDVFIENQAFQELKEDDLWFFMLPLHLVWLSENIGTAYNLQQPLRIILQNDQSLFSLLCSCTYNCRILFFGTKRSSKWDYK